MASRDRVSCGPATTVPAPKMAAATSVAAATGVAVPTGSGWGGAPKAAPTGAAARLSASNNQRPVFMWRPSDAPYVPTWGDIRQTGYHRHCVTVIPRLAITGHL